MKLNHYDIANLSSMICGDYPYKKIFPYRNSEKLSAFFQDLGFNYSYDKQSLRVKWVEAVLTELNDKADPNDPNISPEMKVVIRGMLNPNDFSNLFYTDFDRAKKMLDKLLRQHKIRISEIIEGDEGSKQQKNRSSKKENSAIQDDQFLHIIPHFFTKPNKTVDHQKISVMMPLSADFKEVYDTIKSTCESQKMQCFRADHVWNDSVIIQDIFELIYTSEIVIADFSTRNPNVFYEVGIAHTLGKHVIPITQNMADVPFDLHHHRVLVYHNNNEGREDLKKKLSSRITTLKEDFLSGEL